MSIRDDFFAAKAKGSLWDVAVSIKRGNPLPLDADSIFESYTALETYAAGVLAYPGQVVAVVNADSTGIYYLDQDLAIQPVGVIPSGDGKTIEVTADGVISILGSADADSLTLPRMKEDKSGIEWVPVAQIVQGDGNDNTTYEFAALEDKVGFSVVTKFNGTQVGDAVEYVLDAYTKSEADAITDALDERIDALEAKEDKDTTYSVAANDKVLKLTGIELSSTISLKHENGMISLTGIDGAVIAEFSDADFVKDGMLENVEYDADTNTLSFTWNTAAGIKTDSVVLSDIIEAYTAGNGLNLSGTEFSVKIDASSESFLTVGTDGVKLSGVQNAINTAVEAAEAEVAAEIDNLGKVKTVNGVAPDENGNVQIEVPDSGQNAALTAAQINALDGMFKVCAFVQADVSAEYAAFHAAFGLDSSGGGDTPDEPDNPEQPAKTLTSISAVYSGGSVPVGTAVSGLTGVTVTAHYSDGSTSAVTGYTLSGIIAEGSNTITVTYGGKTATITVEGVAESTGDAAYSPELVWEDGYRIYHIDGSVVETPGWSVSQLIDISEYSNLRVVTTSETWFNAQVMAGTDDKPRVALTSGSAYWGGNYMRDETFDITAYHYLRISSSTANAMTFTVKLK